MSAMNRQKLLFLLIENQKLIYHATQWELREFKRVETLGPAQRLFTRQDGFSSTDLRAVDAHLGLLNELDDESIEMKFVEASSRFSESGPLTKRSVPCGISDADLKDRLKKPKMGRMEATLLSLGFLEPKDGRSDFEEFIYDDRMNNRLSIDLQQFPLSLAFIEREEALSRSDLFKISHWKFRGDEADTLEIFEWFKRMDFDLPDRLLALAKKYHSRKTEGEHTASDTEERELNPKERSSLLQLIHAIAAQKPYLYDPENVNNGAINRIQNTIQDAGLRMSDKTIRKYLREGVSEADRVKDKNQ